MNEALFDYVTGVVIDKLEGGYFQAEFLIMIEPNSPRKLS